VHEDVVASLISGSRLTKVHSHTTVDRITSIIYNEKNEVPGAKTLSVYRLSLD
jgi:hypothetical protein